MEATARDDGIRQDETSVARPSSIAESGAPDLNVIEFEGIAQRDPEGPAKLKQAGSSPARSRLASGNSITTTLGLLGRRLATVGVAIIALLAAITIWNLYNAAPWTRDGSVRVQVANVAPQISGQIKELRVADNQYVHKGDILYVIDPFDFAVALRANKASLEQKIADRDVKKSQAERRRKLSDLSTSTEEKQTYDGNALQAEAAVDAAQQQVAQAEINLKRTEVRSPVNGVVTNLLLREGNYAQAGATNVSIIDTDSYWIDGYFEETKLARLCVGDRAEVKLMGYSSPIMGHIATVTRGVSVSNAAAATQGLPNVDPVYSWVRLAQRVPVRIAIDKVPPGVPLVSGLTATVTIRNGTEGGQRTLSQRLFADVGESLSGLLRRTQVRSNCIPNPS